MNLPLPKTSHLHAERHFRASDMVRDIVIGMADGLTVPFALAAGLSGAVISSQLITTAGLAEIVAGSVAMGLGGYLAVNGDEDHYARERFREQSEVQFTPEQEVAEIVEIFAQYGVSAAQCAQVIEGLRANREAWVNFMMRFELGLEPPKPGRAGRSAATIACAYIAGGLIPITPYFMAEGINALIISAGVTLLALGGFGYLKGYMTGTSRLHSAMQTLLVGGTAAAAAFVLARAVT